MFFEKIDYDKIPQLAKRMESFFGFNKDISKNAYLNWRIVRSWDVGAQFWELSEGYFQSAYWLIDGCLQDNRDKKADIIIFPILFNLIHGIELSLKAINCYLYMVLNKESAIKGKHDIRQLADEAKKRLLDLKKKDNSEDIVSAITAMKLVQKFIGNIYEKTNDMAFARYPIDSDHKEMFYTASQQNVVVDMAVLKEQITYVCNMLDYIMGLLSRYWEYTCEMQQYEDELRHEYEQEMLREFESEMRYYIPNDY